MVDFVKVIDVNDQVQVIAVRHIVRVAQTHPPDWQVILTTGEPVSLKLSEAEKIFKPIAHHSKDTTSEQTEPH